MKIYAGDQISQCCDYYKYAHNSKLYYLTLDGHMPSEKSFATLDSRLVKPISFRKDIIDWLMECLRLTETVRIVPIREVILQLIDVLRKLTNQAEDKMEKEILNLVMESKDSFKNAELIMSAVKEAEQVMYDKYFRRLNECICEKYPNLVDWPEELEKEYNQYSIYYVVKTLKDGNKLCLEIACDQTMYAGFTVCDSNEEDVKCKGYISQEDIMTGKWKSSDMWIAWKYMGYDIEGKIDMFLKNKIEMKSRDLSYSVFEMCNDEICRVLIKDENFDTPYSIVCRIEYKHIGEEYSSKYLSWRNLILCSNACHVAPDSAYMNYAVQNGKKVAATVYPASKDEYERILQTLPKDCDAAPYDLNINDKDYPAILYVCRKGCLKDYFDLSLVRRIYEQHGTFEDYEVDWGKIETLFNVPLISFSNPREIGLNIQTEQSHMGLIITGLLLGYPLESTIAYIKNTKMTPPLCGLTPLQKEEIQRNGYCYDFLGKNKILIYNGKPVFDWQLASLYL